MLCYWIQQYNDNNDNNNNNNNNDNNNNNNDNDYDNDNDNDNNNNNLIATHVIHEDSSLVMLGTYMLNSSMLPCKLL